MAGRLVVAVTDRGWFDLLAARPALDEVNFWSPGKQQFQALQPGELFAFKLRAPANAIVGFGVFVHATVMPCSLAWEAFGTANGAASEAEFRHRLGRLGGHDARDDPMIGCRVLAQPVFLPSDRWLPQPASWKPNTVSFTSYGLEEADGARLWNALNGLAGPAPRVRGFGESQEAFGKPQTVLPRLGQGAFRVLVTDAYERRCAFTGERTLPALDACHIRPYADSREHHPTNGLLLRRDLHTLFDRGYLTVTPEHRIEVSPRIREEFSNGRAYYAMHGGTLRVPARPDLAPDPTALRWHNDERFRP